MSLTSDGDASETGDTSADEGDSGQTSVFVVLTRTGDLDGDLEIDFETFGTFSGDDVSGIPDSLTMAEGQSVVSFEIKVNGDVDVEEDEVFGIRLTDIDLDGVSISETAAEAEHTIANDDVLPTANDDALSTDEDTSLAISANSLLGNDNPNMAGGLIVTSFTQPGNGVVTRNTSDPNILFDYTPGADFAGETSFTYTVQNEDEGTGTATVTITVNPVDDTPTFTTLADYALDENTTLVGSVAATDIDTDDSTLVYSIEGGADAGLFNIDGASGEITFKAAPDWEADNDAGGDNVYELIVGASDDTSTGQQTLAITVENVFERANDEIGSDADSEELVGTDGEDYIETGGGSFDDVIGGGGIDVFVFNNDADGVQQQASLADYNPAEDFIDLQGTDVDFGYGFGGVTYLFMNGTDYDMLVVYGVNSVDEIQFL